ncbi:MAG TPA: T9SS type A sorting domain-containing protein [Bacteroidia bacterium]|nr:T9SS type A sorting domain-containing protein [Bacteroidia bacterium]HRH06971.1 T9SS type A sorting domain-containing protein [Bacteroidia bacterium]
MNKLFTLLTFIIPGYAMAQCTTTNGIGCQCPDGISTNCDLLPDIMVSEYAFQTYQGGPNEYPQTNAGTSVTGQGPDDGRLRLSASTPNVGRGALEIRAVDASGKRWFICGTDTFSINDPNANTQFTCPNGNPNPRQLLKQRVYHKNGNAMTYTERFAGSMTYHPTHGHYHVDDWEIMTIRIQDTMEANPLKWPIVGTGHKVGFCVEDYQSCATANGHCKDSLGNTITNNIINLGHGGGNYGCGNIFQGITVGYTDIYWETLDGQWIYIAPGTCNGQYYVVIQVDPQNFFLESNENNNYFASPIQLTQQNPAGSPVIEIQSNKNSATVCAGDSVELTATAGSSILWSTGATTQKIKVPSSNATYTVHVTNYCGTDSASYTLSEVPASATPVTTGDTVYVSGNATLIANGNGTIKWYNAAGNYLATGDTFVTPTITSSTTYYAENSVTHIDTAFAYPHTNALGAANYVNTAQYELFYANVDFDLLRVKIYAQNAGTITVQLTNNVGTVLQSTTASVIAGLNYVNLNFSVVGGSYYRLTYPGGSVYMLRNNSANVSYPYGVPGVVTLTGSSAGASYYYFFYDWKIATASSTCPSPRVPVLAYVDVTTDMSKYILFDRSLSVYPNPSKGIFTLEFNSPVNAATTVQISDIVGRVISEQQLVSAQGRSVVSLTTVPLQKGVYSLRVTSDKKHYFRKLIVE